MSRPPAVSRPHGRKSANRVPERTTKRGSPASDIGARDRSSRTMTNMATTGTTQLQLATLFLEFGVLLVVLGLLTRLAARLRLSPVPLYLLVGLAFGTGGVIPVDQHAELVPVVAKMGSIVLLLLLGLEYSGPLLVGTLRRHSRSGFIDALINALPGAAAGLLLGWGWLGALTLAGVTYVSSSGVAAQVIRDMRWQRNPESASVVGVLVLEDLVMAPYLPVLAAVMAGVGFVAGFLSVLTAFAVLTAALWLSIRHNSGSSRWFERREDTSGLLLMVFGAALAAAAVAAFASFSPEVAAFLVGLLLTGEVADQVRRRLDPLREVLAAVFFAYFGLSTDPSSLPAVLLPAALLAVVGLGTKVATGWYVGRVDGLGIVARLRAGALLGARGEFAVVIAALVVTSSALPSEVSAFIAAYVVITAVAAPVLARFAEPLGWFLQQRPRGGTGN
jgi:CPA2 family monovalent cation:H+ antiporter-2